MAALIGLLILAGCADPPAEFALPPGDADLGRLAFQQLHCTHCHSVPGDTETAAPVELGGSTHRVKTHADLIAAIINPQHGHSLQSRLAVTGGGGALVSRGPDHNQTMTVRQLIDLTTYLHPHYFSGRPQYVYYQYF